MQLSFSPAEIAAIVKPTATRGIVPAAVTGIASLNLAVAGDLSFLGTLKFKDQVATTKASVILLPPDFVGEPAAGQTFLFVANPTLAVMQVCAQLEQRLWPKPAAGIDPSALVAKSAKIAASATVGPLCIVEEEAVIGERVFLQAQVFVGRAAEIGDDSWLMPGTLVATECILGKRVRLQPGAKIGGDGFGYEFVAGRHARVPQIGNVILGDDVEIGANSTVDRARFSQTVVGEGTKIDNLVQIGHNVIIGKHCLICGQAGVSGSTTIEDYVVLGGQVGVAGHLTIGRGAKAGAQAGIGRDVEPGAAVWGTPYLSYALESRIAVLRGKLPELFKRVGAIEDQLEKSSE